RESVANARVSFTADHLATGHGQCQREELIDALRVAKIDSVDVHRISADDRPTDVGERERLDGRRGAAGVSALQLGGTLGDALIRADADDRVRVALEKTEHVRPGYGRFAARAEEAAVLDEDAGGRGDDEAGEH